MPICFTPRTKTFRCYRNIGTDYGKNDVNIANFTLGRAQERGEAIALLYADHPVPASVLKELDDTGVFKQIKPLEFDELNILTLIF